MSKFNIAETEAKAQKIAEKLVNKSLGKVIAKASLERQSRMMIRLLKVAPVMRIRADLLSNLPSDIVGHKANGMSRDEAVSYFWDEPKFVELCEKLQITKHDIETLIDGVYNPEAGYIDLSAVGVAIQVMIAGGLGSLFILRHRIKNFIFRSKKGNDDDNTRPGVSGSQK